MKKRRFQKASNWRMRIYSVNRNTKNNLIYDRKAEGRTVKMIEKRVQSKPSNTRRMEGPLAVIRLNTRFEIMAG